MQTDLKVKLVGTKRSYNTGRKCEIGESKHVTMLTNRRLVYPASVCVFKKEMSHFLKAHALLVDFKISPPKSRDFSLRMQMCLHVHHGELFPS